MHHSSIAGPERSGRPAFTLIELLVVISIIGLLMFIAVPAFRGFGQSNVMAAAQQQLKDDLSYARQLAVKNRAPVYMVFLLPPRNESPESFANQLRGIHDSILLLPQATPYDRQYRELALRAYTNVFTKQFVSYAMFTESSLGEQPGNKRMRYLTSWRTLPDGALFPTNGMELLLPVWVTRLTNQVDFTNLTARPFPFPVAPEPDNLAVTEALRLRLPAIAFDAQGRLFNFDEQGRPIGNGTTLADRYLAVSAGSVLLGRQLVPKGEPERFDFNQAADVVETPRRNYTNQLVRVSALTGRAKSLRPPLESIP